MMKTFIDAPLMYRTVVDGKAISHSSQNFKKTNIGS